MDGPHGQHVAFVVASWTGVHARSVVSYDRNEVSMHADKCSSVLKVLLDFVKKVFMLLCGTLTARVRECSVFYHDFQ